MNPTQNPTITIVAFAGALLALLVYHLIARYLQRRVIELNRENRAAIRTIDALASFVDLVKSHTPAIENDADVQRLAADVLVKVEQHRAFRCKNSPSEDLLIRDLREIAGRHGPRDNSPAPWVIAGVRE